MFDQNRRSIVVCVGNELIADDAAGHEVYLRLVEKGFHGRVEYCGVGGIDMLPLLNGESDLVVVDAVQLGAEPGTVHVIPWDALPPADGAVSAHGLGLRETLEICRILYPERMPERVTLVGIEGRCFNLTREHMTEAVARSIDRAAAMVNEIAGGNPNG